MSNAWAGNKPCVREAGIRRRQPRNKQPFNIIGTVMKKIASIASVIAIMALSATAWQIHIYDIRVQSVERQLEMGNLGLNLMVSELKARIELLTNHPPVSAKEGRI